MAPSHPHANPEGHSGVRDDSSEPPIRQPAEGRTVIAVMSGLQDEIQKLVESITVVEQKKALDRTIYCGEFEGQKTFVVGSGVGKVRASAFAQ